MICAFDKIICCIVLVLAPVYAMNDYLEEEIPKILQVRAIQQVANLEGTFSIIPSKKGITTINALPPEILLTTFRFLSPHDLGRTTQVSTRWKRVTDKPDLWRYMGSRYYGDFLSEEDLRENPNQKVVFHYLSVIVNATENLKEIERLVSHYRLDLYTPLCKKYLGPLILTDLVSDIPTQKEFIAQGSREVIKRSSEATQKKIEGLEEGKYGYEKNPLAARDLNELLVKEGDLKAIERKINGLLCGNFGYEINWAEAREVNDFLVEEANLEAIQRKIRGLEEGKYGYEKNPLAARELNELLVKERDLKAIERKINGLLFGTFGYEMNFGAAMEFNELLIKEGDSKAIERKKNGFSFFVTTQEEDPVTCKFRMSSSSATSDSSKEREFNEFLVAQGDPKGMWEKILGLQYGNRGYKSDPSAVAAVLEPLIEKGDPKAIQMKLEGLLKGKYGYEKDPEAARVFNEFFVEKGNIEAIERKIKGLVHGYFGYEKNQIAVKEFNELLIEKGNPKAIQMKLEGLLKGKYGYEKNSVAARELLHQFLAEEANRKAIERQIEALERGWDDRERDPEIATKLKELLAERELNELRIQQGNREAVQRKIEGLLQGKYGYEKDSTAARELLHQLLTEKVNIETIERQIEVTREQEIKRELNESLVKRGNLRAIDRKLRALSAGGAHPIPFNGYSALLTSVQVPTYGYKKDPEAARELNESLVKKGDSAAIERKIQALLGEAVEDYTNSEGGHKVINFTYGYERDLKAAREFNEFLVINGNQKAIQRKIQGLIEGKYGYKIDPQATKEFIESLVLHDVPIARGIGKYIKAFAMKYGIKELGYQEDRKKAIEFIRENNVPF